MSPDSALLSCQRQPTKLANRLQRGGVLAALAQSESGMQQAPFCLTEQSAIHTSGPENWASALRSWQGSTNRNITRTSRSFSPGTPQQKSWAKEGLLKPETPGCQDQSRARPLHEQRQRNPENAEAHTWPPQTRTPKRHQRPQLLVPVCTAAMAIAKALGWPTIPQALTPDTSGNHCKQVLCCVSVDENSNLRLHEFSSPNPWFPRQARL